MKNNMAAKFTSLLISDIHARWQKADQIVKRFKDVDEVVCLGDYFDNFDDSPKLNGRTAEWLKEFMAADNHHALIGNHEFNYMFDKCIYQCSGYSSSKKWRINHVLSMEDWYNLKTHYVTQGWYLTHAGITSPLVVRTINGWDANHFEEQMKKSKAGWATCYVDRFFEAGMHRGGNNAYGGITWCQFPEEFQPIDAIKQIFGHTPGKEPRQYKDTNNWCLDTHLHHVGLLEDGALSIVPV